MFWRLPMAQTKKPLSSRMFRLVAGLVFCWMLLLNFLTPYLADDYTFAYALIPANGCTACRS